MKSGSMADYLLLGLLSLIWSTSFLLIKIAVHSMDPITLTAIRLLIAAALLLSILRIKGMWLRFTPQALRLYLVIGVLGNAVPFSLISMGEVHITSSMTAILMGIMPISTFVLAHLFVPAEPMTRRKVGGVLLGFSGLVSLVGLSALGALGSHPAGQLAVLGGALCYSLSAVYVRTQSVVNGLEAAAGAMVVAALTCLPLAFLLEDPISMQPRPGAIWSTVALGVFHTALAALIYFRTIRNLGAVLFAQINYLIPVLGSLWGILLLGESVGWRTFAALGLVLSGIYFIQPARRSKPALPAS
jgi:drug/metabolite transporter (DMT)-like permease